MNEQELKEIKEHIEEESIVNLLALWLIYDDELNRRMKKCD